MSAPLTPSQALRLLFRHHCPENVIAHSKAVARLALKNATKIKKAGHDVDLEFVEVAALLHDIGRCRTHGIKHGIEGAKILENYPSLARVCERHLGAGIKKEEAIALGLPPKDYLPETLEEKIIADADNFIFETRVVSEEEVKKKLEKILGKNHPAIKRVMRLHQEIKELMDPKKL